LSKEHLGQLIGGEDAVAVDHGEDGMIPFGQTMDHRHDHPAVDLWSRSSSHTHHPNESGFATGGVRAALPLAPPTARCRRQSPRATATDRVTVRMRQAGRHHRTNPDPAGVEVVDVSDSLLAPSAGRLRSAWRRRVDRAQLRKGGFWAVHRARVSRPTASSITRMMTTRRAVAATSGWHLMRHNHRRVERCSGWGVTGRDSPAAGDDPGGLSGGPSHRRPRRDGA
jgi:hypothetical protein